MYDDVISRQAAIDSICRTVCDNPEICVSPCDEVKILRNMPSAEPEKRTEERTETHACDLIDRQDAIRIVDSIDTWQAGWRGNAIESLKALPPAQPDVLACGEGELIAQPEIIRCNDCKHWTQTTGNMCGFGLGDCDYINAKLVNCNGFCSWAERRADG